MAPIFLKIVLVFAIAISQAIGGVSCCCLGSALSESLFLTQGSSLHRGDVNPFSELQSACPKCRTRDLSGASEKRVSVAKNKFSYPGVGRDSRCNCDKHEISSDVPSEPVSVKHSVQLSIQLFRVKVSIFDQVRRLHDYNVPIRFGGHSWQSIVCVWRN